jgi:uncharacterized protein (TIGR00251 family)
MLISIKVIPKSSHNKIVGWENGELKIKIAAPPEKGSANEELIAYLAESLHLSKSSITLLKGETSRHKRLNIEGLTSEQLEELLKAFHV